MGQEHSSSFGGAGTGGASNASSSNNQGTEPCSENSQPPTSHHHRQSTSSIRRHKFRHPSQLLLIRNSKRHVQAVDASGTKKVKVPATGTTMDPTQAPATTNSEQRERLLSCPDFHHHTESEMVKRLERILVPKVMNQSPSSADTEESPIQVLVKRFDGANPPKISITSYLQRLVFYLGGIAEQERKCGTDMAVHSDIGVRYVLSAILYVERIQQRTGMVVTLYNVHRLLITGTMIAAKVLDDMQPNQKYFADLGGVSTAELTRLEAAFLQLCDYNVNVDPELFAAKYATALDRERVFSDVSEALTQGAIFSPKTTSSKTLMV